MYLALDLLANVTGPKMSAAVALNAPWTEINCNYAFRSVPAVDRAAERSQLAKCFQVMATKIFVQS